MRAATVIVVLALAAVLAVVLFRQDDPRPDAVHGTVELSAQEATSDPADAARAPAAAASDTQAEQSTTHADCADLFESQMQQLYDDVLTEERINEIIDEARTTLGDSAQLELRLFAAQLEDSAAGRIEIFRRSIDAGDVTAHFLWSAVNTCLVHMQTVSCPAEDWLNRLLAVDSENSEAWMRAAGYYYANDQPDRAKQALDRARIAYESNSYWYEDIMSAKAGADAVGGFSERASYLMAIGFAATYPAPMRLYSEMCNSMSGRDPEWAYACAAYGERAGETGTTIMTRQLAKAIQANALVALGEAADSERIRALKTPARLLSEREMLRYPDSIMLYMSALESGSEVDAADALMLENERRRELPVPPECGDFRLD